jgi:hypothetical protein
MMNLRSLLNMAESYLYLLLDDESDESAEYG